jgi:hypothetical protein
MNATQIDRALLRTLPALSMVAPLVIFGFIYVLAIVPARQGALAARSEVETSRDALVRTRSELQDASLLRGPAAAPRSFYVRTASDLADAVRTVADSQSVGGVDQLSVQIHGAAVSVTFDARYAQLDEFFSSLDAITGAYDVSSVDIVRKENLPLMRATVEFLVRGEPAVVPTPAPQPPPLVADASLGQEKRGRVPF